MLLLPFYNNSRAFLSSLNRFFGNIYTRPKKLNVSSWNMRITIRFTVSVNRKNLENTFARFCISKQMKKKTNFEYPRFWYSSDSGQFVFFYPDFIRPDYVRTFLHNSFHFVILLFMAATPDVSLPNFSQKNKQIRTISWLKTFKFIRVVHIYLWIRRGFSLIFIEFIILNFNSSSNWASCCHLWRSRRL